MEIVKALLLNGVSMLLALLVAFFILYLIAGKKKGGCGCGGSAPAAKATELVSIDELM